MAEVKICERCGKQKRMMSWERICFQCMKAEELERVQERVRAAEPDETPDTWSSDYVICPYCGEAMDTNVGYEDFPEIYEDGDHQVECPECGKVFTLETSVSYTWETRK